MTSEPRAFLAIDVGSATTAVSLLGSVAGRWRLLGSLSVPAGVPHDLAITLVADRFRAADPALAEELGAGDGRTTDAGSTAEPVLEWPRLAVRTGAPPRMAAIAATERSLASLARAGRRAGWIVDAASVESMDPLAMTRLLLRPEVGAVLVGAGDPPGGDERSALVDLVAVTEAVAVRRPEMTIVLAGAVADEADRFEALEGRTGSLLLAPAATAGEPRGEPLRALLDELRSAPDDGRRAIVRSTATLAEVLGRIVETWEIGASAGMRVVATPTGAGGQPVVRSAVVVDAALVPADLRDEVADGIGAWSTIAFDRHRLRDRLRELRLSPWSEAHGEGALLRSAAIRAALVRLAAVTADMEPPTAPDVVIATGGAWAVMPGPAIGLAIVDAVRRSGTSQLTHDHARLLGPLGAIAEEPERRRMIADLEDDLLAPLGATIVPAGLRAGKSAGRLVVHGATGTTDLDLVPGGLELVDLPPGDSAVAELEFRDTVALGARGRHFAVEVAGGLGGLLVDLRDVPLRLPDRHDRRRQLLSAWQRSLWAGLDD